jgi:hypothetical protein
MRYAVIVFIVSLASISASAQNLIVDGLTGYGVNIQPNNIASGVNRPNAQRFGLGVRVGYKFNPSVYLGLSVFSHFGAETTSPAFQLEPNGQLTTIGTSRLSQDLRYFTLDLGYQAVARQFTIRPMLSFGILGLSIATNSASQPNTDGNVIGRPALNASYQFSKEFSLGVEACYIKSLNRWSSSFADGYSFFLVASYSLY